MHIIKDMEALLGEVKETIEYFFGKDEAGVVGHEAIKAVINDHIVAQEKKPAAKKPKEQAETIEDAQPVVGD